VVDRGGVPLVVRHTAANVHDSNMLEAMLDAVSPIRRPRGRPGRPRKHPEKLHADKGYDFGRCREALRQRNIIPRIGRCGLDSSERLGRHRWVAERTLAWLNRYRKLKALREAGRRASGFPKFGLRVGLLELHPTGMLDTLRLRGRWGAMPQRPQLTGLPPVGF
jgi:hypothetical protein